MLKVGNFVKWEARKLEMKLENWGLEFRKMKPGKFKRGKLEYCKVWN